jgi:hypothetical protein
MFKMGFHDWFGVLKTHVMAKRKVGNQTANLTPNHYKSRITLIYLRAGGVPHIVGKLWTRTITFLQISPQS